MFLVNAHRLCQVLSDYLTTYGETQVQSPQPIRSVWARQLSEGSQGM
jgi:hypothetical protein